MKDYRTVHARYEGMEIVRYDRAGKWYLEPLDPSLRRQHVTLAKAVQAAIWGAAFTNGRAFLGKPGGAAFDRAYMA